MQKNTFYASILLLLTISAHTASGMMQSPTTIPHGLDRDIILEQLYGQYEQVETFANELCAVALQKTSQGRIFFHVPHYEQYLNSNTAIPWQTLFVANRKMIDAITNHPKAHNDERFKSLQRAVIYCETARELLKRKRAGDHLIVSILSLQNLALATYADAYKYDPRKLKNAHLVATQRWKRDICRHHDTPTTNRK